MGVFIDILLLAVVIVCIIYGVKRGAVSSLAGLAGVVLAVIFAPKLGVWISGFFPKTQEVNRLGRNIVCCAVAFLLIMLAAKLVGHLLSVLFQLPVLHGINRFFGGVLGAVKGVVLALLACAVLRLALPVLAVKYPDKVKLSSFDDSAVLQLQTAPVSAAPKDKKDELQKDGKELQQKAQSFFGGLPQEIKNPVYTFYEQVLKGDVQANADKK